MFAAVVVRFDGWSGVPKFEGCSSSVHIRIGHISCCCCGERKKEKIVESESFVTNRMRCRYPIPHLAGGHEWICKIQRAQCPVASPLSACNLQTLIVIVIIDDRREEICTAYIHKMVFVQFLTVKWPLWAVSKHNIVVCLNAAAAAAARCCP